MIVLLSNDVVFFTEDRENMGHGSNVVFSI